MGLASEIIEIKELTEERKRKSTRALITVFLLCLFIFAINGARITTSLMVVIALGVTALVTVVVKNVTGAKPQGPVLIIDHEGILDKRLKVGKILWPDIKRVFLKNLHSQIYICIETKRDDFYLDRCGGVMKILLQVNRLNGMTPLYISANLLDKNETQIFELIAAKHRAIVGGQR